MAGLLLRELMQRGDVSRVLVLCPKALTDQCEPGILEAVLDSQIVEAFDQLGISVSWDEA